MSKSVTLTIILFFILLFFVFLNVLFSYNILDTYENQIMSFNYSNLWEVVSKNSTSIELTDKYYSKVQFVQRERTDNNEGLEQIYYDYEEEFSNNNNLNLINYGKTIIGKDYLDAYEFLYETSNTQTLLILLVENDYIIEITYTSSFQTYDVDLINFYNILNSLKIKK